MTAGRSPDAPAGRHLPRGWAAVVLLAVAAAGVAGWLARRAGPTRPPSDDPRRTYVGPYRNIDPAVAYVGDERCAPCHQDKEDAYRSHPMANTLLPVARTLARLPLDSTHHNPFRAFGSLFRVDVEAQRVWHRQMRTDGAGKPVCELAHEVHYAVGFGSHGRSYLSDHDGYLFQTPISYFGQAQTWDLSPGFSPPLLPGRQVIPGCLFCHANPPQADDDRVNYYPAGVFHGGHAIGCERCHGPGALHAESGAKLDIVNPHNLSWRLREAVCEQCHLEGLFRVAHAGRRLEEFRPGLGAEQFWTVLVHAGGGEGRRAVGHVEQMYQSTCFRASPDENKLGCVSCHDPHVRVAPKDRVAHYRDRCQRCHEEHGCSLALAERRRRQPDDSCIACHMAPFANSDVVHTASTDHRILRRKEAAPDRDARPDFPDLPVASFYRDRQPAGDAGADRDVAVALVQLAEEGELPSRPATSRALSMLEAALRRDGDDVAALAARADALRLQSRLLEALAAYEAVLARRPGRERALAEAAGLAEGLHKTELALTYWQRAVSANPWMAAYRRRLAGLLAGRGRWADARPHAEAWRRLDPTSAAAQRLWVRLLLHEGRKADARAAFAILEVLDPTDLDELRAALARPNP
jgi:tetratricopeptide (TPR) repeat protein